MKHVSSLVLALALLLGAAGGFLAYTHAAAPTAAAATTPATSAATPVAAPAPAPHRARHAHRRTVVQWAPCAAGSSLVDGVCVTDVVRTVTVYAAAPAVSHPSSTGSSAHGDDGGRGEGGDDGGGRGEHEGGGGHDD